MVWKDSVTIGCAANLRCRFKTWICQFTPPGEALPTCWLQQPLLQ
jgi:hypothetical protein